MTEAVLQFALEKLNSLIGKELGLFLGFDHDMKKLTSLFTTIKATLQDAEERQFSMEAIKDWLGKLKDAAHELDDIMDEYAYEASGLGHQGVKCCLSDKVHCSCLSSFHPKHVISRRKIAKEMKRIIERLEEISEEKTKFHLSVIVPNRSEVIKWRQTGSAVDEKQVFGRKEEKDKVVDFLVGDASHSENLSVYPIVGQGGLGKTTLAQLIFNHESVVNHFEPKLWVCVSEDFSLERMTKAIIEAATQRACADMDLYPLQGILKGLLHKKRYFLVLDDVWDDDQDNWEILKTVLAHGAKGACILVTTRLFTVAEIMGTIKPPLELSILSDNDCWELFKRRAFGPDEKEHEHEKEHTEQLVHVGREIVKKCGGVPLAAQALGGLLRMTKEKDDWLNVRESNPWSLKKNMMPALTLSYLKLSTKLRQCFAYCAIFPKNERIWKQDLIELWMANGFLASTEYLSAEDDGDHVWMELYWRSFFQDIEKDEFGKVTSFKMHNLVHDLAQFVAEEVCCITKDNCANALAKRIHHLANHRQTWNPYEEVNSIQLQQMKSLRTYLFLYRNETGHQFSPDVLKCCTLRVLRWECIIELSSSIDCLKHLRYLNLSGGQFRTLPESLCKLWNLQILKLDGCQHLEKLPDKLICLKALKQLSLIGCDSLSGLPPHIGKLTSLRSLSIYFVGKERGFLLAELGQLKLKGELHINHLEKVQSVVDAREANMLTKKLNRLWLSWNRSEESVLQENVEQILEVLQPDTQQLQSLSVVGYKGSRFPQWMSNPSLKKLEIKGCHKFNLLAGFKWLTCLQDLSIGECREVEGLHEALQHMTALKSLKLRDLPNLESLSDCFGNPGLLRELTIHNCPKLKCLPRSQSLSSLKKLTIDGCTEVEDLHEALQHMTALDTLHLSNLPNLKSLSDHFGNHGLLLELSIHNCPKLKCLPRSRSLSSLKKLSIDGCTEVEDLHEALQHITALDTLHLSNLPNLKSLSDHFGNHGLPRVLSIHNCSSEPKS